MNIPFDALSTFFIFLIGIPALVIENQAPELRRIVLRRPRSRWLYFRTGVWIVLALVIIGLGVFLDLLPNDNPATDDRILSFALVGLNYTLHEAWIWLGVFALLVVISIVATVRFLRRYGGYRGILDDLHKEIIKPLRQDAVPYLQHDSLKDLIELGRQSDAGQDKDQVLQEISRLVHQVCAHPKYRGDSLEDTIKGLVGVVGADPNVGSSLNFEAAAKILEHILTGEQRTVPLERTDDISDAIRVLSQLGRQAARQLKAQIEIEATLNVYLETLDLAADKYSASLTDVTQALLELGSVALEEHQMVIAMGALQKLIILLESTSPPQQELTADVLGLMAHFWGHGETSRALVRARLGDIQPVLTKPLPEALGEAQQHCAQTSRFKTSDCLHEMLCKLYPPLPANAQAA